MRILTRTGAAHAVRAFDEGRNAIAGAAILAAALHAPNGRYEGGAVSVAKISGGGALNVVADNVSSGSRSTPQTRPPDDCRHLGMDLSVFDATLRSRWRACRASVPMRMPRHHSNFIETQFLVVGRSSGGGASGAEFLALARRRWAALHGRCDSRTDQYIAVHAA